MWLGNLMLVLAKNCNGFVLMLLLLLLPVIAEAAVFRRNVLLTETTGNELGGAQQQATSDQILITTTTTTSIPITAEPAIALESTATTTVNDSLQRLNATTTAATTTTTTTISNAFDSDTITDSNQIQSYSKATTTPPTTTPLTEPTKEPTQTPPTQTSQNDDMEAITSQAFSSRLNNTEDDVTEVPTSHKQTKENKDNTRSDGIQNVKDGLDRDLLQDYSTETTDFNEFNSSVTTTESYLPDLENLAVKSKLSNIVDFKEISTSETTVIATDPPLENSTATSLTNHQNKTKQGRAMLSSSYRSENETENEVLTTEHGMVDALTFKDSFKTTTEALDKHIAMRNSSILRNLNTRNFKNAANADKLNEITVSASGEKRGKFINDNSTNAQQMNLPDMTEVWTLVGMKAVPKSNASMEQLQTTEHSSNETTTRYHQSSSPSMTSGGNNEKTLVDWMKIMSNSMDLLPTKNQQNQLAEDNDIESSSSTDKTKEAAAFHKVLMNEMKATTSSTTTTLKPLPPSLLNEIIASTADKTKAKLTLPSSSPTTSSTTVYQNLSEVTPATLSPGKTENVQNFQNDVFPTTAADYNTIAMTTTEFPTSVSDLEDAFLVDSSTSVQQATLYPHIADDENDTSRLTSLTPEIVGKDEHANAYATDNILPTAVNDTMKSNTLVNYTPANNGITTTATTAVAYDTTTTMTTDAAEQQQSTIPTTTATFATSESTAPLSTFTAGKANVSSTRLSGVLDAIEIANHTNNNLVLTNKANDEEKILPPVKATTSSPVSSSSSSSIRNHQVQQSDNENSLEVENKQQTADHQSVDSIFTNANATTNETSSAVKTSLNKQTSTINEDEHQTTNTTANKTTIPIITIANGATPQPTAATSAAAATTFITTALPTPTTTTTTKATLLSTTTQIISATTSEEDETPKNRESPSRNRIANENTVKDTIADNDYLLKTTTTTPAEIHSSLEVSSEVNKEIKPSTTTTTTTSGPLQNLPTDDSLRNTSLDIRNTIEGLLEAKQHRNKENDITIMPNSNEDGADSQFKTNSSNKPVEQQADEDQTTATDVAMTTMPTAFFASNNFTNFNGTSWNDDDSKASVPSNEIESKSEDVYKIIVDTTTATGNNNYTTSKTTTTMGLPEYMTTETATTTTSADNSVYLMTSTMSRERHYEGSLPPALTTIVDSNSIDNHSNNFYPMPSESANETDINVIVAITVSVIGVVALILLVAFLYLMRKRQKSSSYSQRCRPVSLDDYTIDNTSIYNSMRTKGSIMRSSKRSHANLAFDDPSLRHNILDVTELAKFVQEKSSIFEEFRGVPQVKARIDEVPNGCEDKNRYANVVPLPETRVVLQRLNDDPKTEYINANYVRGPKDAPHYYIACQAPLDNTIEDFWRMIWEQQSRVIIQATDLIEGGVNKCAEYLPPSVTLDNHCTYGDYQIVLQNREVKDRYAISTLILRHINENNSREITHYWYKWPETGVPNEEAPIIAMLLEVRSSLISYAIEQANELKEKLSTNTVTLSSLEENTNLSSSDAISSSSPNSSPTAKATAATVPNGNHEINGNLPSNTTTTYRKTTKNQGPLTVHCSPGTGRTGTIIACDIALRSLEMPKRTVDVPQIVYYVRHGRASAVLTKEQYEFIYKVANMYATKISSNSNDN